MSSNGFGHRHEITRHGLQTLQHASKDGRGSGPDGSSLLDRLRAVLIGLGIIGLMVAVYVTTMRGFGSALDKRWAGNAGYSGVEDTHRGATPSGSQPIAPR